MPLLPFLKDKKRETGVIVQQRAPDAESEGSDNSALEAAAQDILSAITQGDATHLALAIKAAFDICDSQPHEEGPHTNEEEI